VSTAVATALAFWVALAAAAPDGRQLLWEIEAYDTQIGSLDAQLITIEAALASAEAEGAERLAEASAAEQQIAARSKGASALLRGLYRIHRYGVVRLLFGADDAVELRRRSHYLSFVIAADVTLRGRSR